jgi:hypothetical protein
MGRRNCKRQKVVTGREDERKEYRREAERRIKRK